MKRKISTISNNSFDSIYSEKKLRLLKIIVPPLLKFPDIFSSSLGRRSGRGNWMERLEGKFENDSYEFEVKIFREGCTIRVFRSKEQKNPSNAFHYPFFLIIHLIPCLLSSFHIPVPFCHMNRPQFELERKVEILLERIRSGKMKYHRVAF